MDRQRRVEHPVSAGGVVYRVKEGVIEVALCRRLHPNVWCLPKGTPNPGETLEQAAAREVREETGLQVAEEGPIDHISYWFVRPSDGVRCHKRVYFYLMRPVGGSLDCHDPEFDTVSWTPAEQALQLLTYRNEARIVEAALQNLPRRALC